MLIIFKFYINVPTVLYIKDVETYLLSFIENSTILYVIT